MWGSRIYKSYVSIYFTHGATVDNIVGCTPNNALLHAFTHARLWPPRLFAWRIVNWPIFCHETAFCFSSCMMRKRNTRLIRPAILWNSIELTIFHKNGHHRFHGDGDGDTPDKPWNDRWAVMWWTLTLEDWRWYGLSLIEKWRHRCERLARKMTSSWWNWQKWQGGDVHKEGKGKQ